MLQQNALVFTWKAKLVDGANEFEESHTVFGELGHVFADHGQRGLEDSVQNGGNDIQQKILMRHILVSVLRLLFLFWKNLPRAW